MLLMLAGVAQAQTEVRPDGKSETEFAAEIALEVANMPILEAEKPWKEHGYPGFVESIDALVGPGAHDCGYFDTDKGRQTAELRAAVRGCIEDAIAGGNPFKFGYEGLAVDAHQWKVIARAPSGELWVVQFFAGPNVADRKQSQLNEVCRSVKFFRGFRTIDEGCVQKSRGPLPSR
jgi:hypothetical protein